MKKNKIIFFLFAILNLNLIAQVAIEKTQLDGSSILDFKAGTTKGIILPALDNIPATPTNGLMGLYTPTQAVYMYENGAFVQLTEGAGNITALIPNTSADTGNGVIIGANSSTATGVLVLESSTLALTLPKVASPNINVKGPYPGMICYDTTSNTLAVFDGSYWNYWK